MPWAYTTGPTATATRLSPMGRRRTVNHDLPPRMARKGQRYYYVSNVPRRWIPLGADLAAAKRKWAELESGPQAGLSVADLCQRYIDRNRDDLSQGTIRQYGYFLAAVREAFPIPAGQLTAQHVALWRDLPSQRNRKAFINGCLALLRAAFSLGNEQGLSVALAVKGWTLKPRDRYLTDDEYRTIRERAPEWLQIAMDLGYLTAARRGDLLALQWADIPAGSSKLSMRQGKTRQRISFSMSAELSAVLDRARQRRVLGLTVIARPNGKPVTANMMDEHWRAACKAAGVEDAHFHDIRGKAATDAANGGQDYQKLLGHASKRMSDRYVKLRNAVVAEPVRRKL